jgi:UDP-N-acetylglucosamine 1-carboxyvinyltransferase
VPINYLGDKNTILAFIIYEGLSIFWVDSIMDQYIIKGGMSLAGEVVVSGAKNAALGILAAAIMTDEEVLIDNLPDVKDINVMLEAIAQTGVYVDRINRNKVKINASKLHSCVVDDEYIRRIRASYYLIGALLGKYHKAEVALPGGCEIGARPIDQHLKGFRALGADIDISSGRINASSDKLKGAHIFLDIVSVGATINIMLAASLIPGKTVIENVAKEPHIVDVANFLNSMGADIKGAGTDVIRINGVSKLHGTEYSIIPDQIEAGTFMCAAAITRGDVTVKNLIPKHMEAISAKLIEIGCEITEFDDAIRVRGAIRQRAANVKTLPYPGFPTDMQPQITAVLARAHGTSTVLESIFENRFRYVSELARMGAEIEVKGNMAVVSGVDKLVGANLNAPDLRAGAALVIAALAADGISTISDIKYIQRGYEHFEEKLESLGAKIALVDTEKAAQKFILKVS